MPLFEVAMLLKPTKKEQEDGAVEKLVYGPRTVIAKDGNIAGMLAMRDDSIPKDLDMDRVEVLIRPFA